MAARRQFPGAPEPFIDLSTGINPHPYPVTSLPEACYTRLPEPEQEHALRVAAAGCYGVPSADFVTAAPGTQALIQLLPRLFKRNVGVLSPTYSEHALSWGAAASPVSEPAALADFEVAVLCHPNNPDGRVVPAPLLLSLADQLASRDGFLLVDEAFADFEPGISLAKYLPHPGLILLRSFGKPFGLAGLRLGFALSDPSRAQRLRAALGPWAVSGPALTIGTSALADRAWLNQAASVCADDASRLDQMLIKSGMEIIGGTKLFRLVLSSNASDVALCLAEAGILVRMFEAQPKWIRFGLPGTPSAWERLQKALGL